MLSLKKFFTFGVALACVANATSLFGQCCCVDPSSDVAISVGWRRDELKSSFDHNDNVRRHFDAKNLNVWEIGLNFNAQLPDWCSCGCCGSNWLRQVYVRGDIFTGWITDGKFHNRNSDDVSAISSCNNGRRHIKNGDTLDADIAVGFLWPACGNFRIGPVVGYSYDEINVKSSRGHRDDSSGSGDFCLCEISCDDCSGCNSRGGFRLKEKWEGPFLGFDATYNWCYCDRQFALDFGYEYHWSKLRTSLHHHDFEGIHGRSKNAWGNVVWIDGHYYLRDCWDFTLGFDWKDYRSKKSHHHGDESQGRLRNRSAEWTSFGIHLGLGYRF